MKYKDALIIVVPLTLLIFSIFGCTITIPGKCVITNASEDNIIIKSYMHLSDGTVMAASGMNIKSGSKKTYTYPIGSQWSIEGWHNDELIFRIWLPKKPTKSSIKLIGGAENGFIVKGK